MKYILSLIISGALVVSGFGQTRNVLVGTNNAVVQPTNFWSADASNARTGLGLGSAATNPASAFQPSSATLSNLSLGNATGITNITASNVVGTLSVIQGGTGSTNASDARNALGLGTAATNPATAFQSSSLSLSNLASGNGGNLTNLQASNLVGVIPASNIPSVTFTNLSGTLSVAQGGTGATNASDARQNLGSTTVGDAVFVATNSASARTALGATTIGGNIFTATDASAVRTLISLGTAATNPATAFQPSSLALTNLAVNDGGSLTNIQASNLVGTIAASNIPTVNLTNISGVLAVNKGGTGATDAANARQNLGSTTVGNAIFVATNAEAARTALSLGTAATSAVTAFQPANANLTNLSTNNGASLTGIPISGVVNLQSNLDTKLATNGNGSGLTSLTAANINGTVALASNITGTAPLATNVTGTVALANGGTGATNAASARTALGASTVGGNLFTLVNPSAIRFLRLNADNTATALSASDFRTAIGLSTAATNAESAFQPASTNLTTLAGNNGSGLTNLVLSNVVGLQSALDGKLATNGSAAGLTGFVGTTNAATARTNLGLGWPALTNTDATSFRNAIGLGTTNTVEFAEISSDDFSILSNAIYFGGVQKYEPETQTFQGDVFLNNGSLTISGTNAAAKIAATRTNLGLPWSGLTNTNAATFQASLFGANTNPVLVDTNGEVVSPTNFWQVAPITTTFIESQPTTNFTTNITAARFLHIHSLNTNIVNVTNTIALPTNGSTYNGDIALVVHQGPTNSMTRVRSVGSTNDIVTMTRYNEAIEFVYYNNSWQFNHNQAFTEPIYFAGTNAAVHVAESRTNLGLGATNDVSFSDIQINESGEDPVFVKNESGFLQFVVNTNIAFSFSDSVGTFNFPIEFNNTTNAATTRTNLGIPLAALTNTNNSGFQRAIFQTNTTPSAGANLGDAKAWIEISVVTNSVTNSFRIPVFQ